jgi:hypothetical protein
VPDLRGKKIPIPEISEKMGLSLKDAKAEYRSLLNAPKPVHGWSVGIANKINTRLIQLKDMIVNHVMETE